MIFPEIPLEEWLKKHPDLEVRKDRCTDCGKSITTDKPFLSKEWIGLAAICECGFHGASSMYARSGEMENMLSTLFWSVEDSDYLKK